MASERVHAAAVGNAQARVEVDPDERSHPHEQLGHTINLLLADLGQDVADTRAVLAREEGGARGTSSPTWSRPRWARHASF